MLDTVYVVRELPGRHFLSTTTIQPIASAVSAPSTKSTSLRRMEVPLHVLTLFPGRHLSACPTEQEQPAEPQEGLCGHQVYKGRREGREKRE